MLAKFNKKKPATIVVLYYIGFIILATFILKLPFLFQNGESASWLDSFFMSNSAVATTGLAVVDYTQVYNYLGWLVYIILFNIGGMGIIVLNTIIILVLGKKIGYKQRVLAKMDYNQDGEVNIVTVLRNVVRFFLAFEIVGIILIFAKIGYMYDNVIDRFMNASFMAASAISGSGFYNTVPYKEDYFVQIVLMVLMIFSFIGYPVIIDTYRLVKAKFKRENYRVSFFTKIVVKVNLITVLLFAVIFFLLEGNHAMGDYTIFQKVQYSMYMSISTKSVGLNVFSDITEWYPITLLLHTFFMLIGGSPSSACGGIKVTSIYLIYRHVKDQLRGKTRIIIDKHLIRIETVLRAYLVTVMFLLLSFVGTLIIFINQPDIQLGYIWYDVVSGFTTTGFSTGALAEFNQLSIFIISLLMGLGRIGIINLVNLAYTDNRKKENRIQYVEKDLAL